MYQQAARVVHEICKATKLITVDHVVRIMIISNMLKSIPGTIQLFFCSCPYVFWYWILKHHAHEM